MHEFTSPSTLQGAAFYLLQSHSRHECRTSTVALEDAGVQQCRLCVRLGRPATQQGTSVSVSRSATAQPLRDRHIMQAARRIFAIRPTKQGVLLLDAALAKRFQGVEQWTYSSLSSLRRCCSRWARCCWAC